MNNKTFDNATLMITGGTGSFGSTVLKHFLDSDLKEIRIFSRDEKKQDDMRHELQAKHPEAAKKVKFYIGDVRNPQSIKDAMPGVDYIFHAAALKQVPSCEFFPMQAVQTNIIGTDNVLHAAIDAGVKRVVCLSTVQKLFGDTGTNIIGTRHGEKLFETLMTREERLRSEDMGHYFRVAADNRDLNYDKFVVKGEVHTMADESYTSHNTNRLDVEGTVKKILTTEYVQNALKGIPNV